MILPIVGFCGMSHLGISSASASISNGFQTICFDTDKEKIKNLKNSIISINEPNLKEVMDANRDLINFTSNFKTLINCNIIYISLDIKTDDKGNSDLEEIKCLINKVLHNLNRDAVLIILSQVSPGFTRSYYKKFNNIFYQVETLIFGKAYERAMYPERYIIGCRNPHQHLPDSLITFLEKSNCPILKMSFESAELTKIAINMCLISSITMSNKMSEICESLGANWNEIIPALRLDKRIGKHSYINAELGISGGNLERDIATTIKIASNFNINEKYNIHNNNDNINGVY